MSEEFDRLDPDEVDVEVMSAYHIGGDSYGVSLQLSDVHNEISRSFIYRVNFGKELSSDTVLRIEALLLDHISLSEHKHIGLQVGGITHHINRNKNKKLRGPKPFTNKLWHLDSDNIFLYGELGTVCRLRNDKWQVDKPVTNEFLRCMAGTNTDRIFAGGDSGTLLQFDGESWSQISLPLGQSIQALEVLPDGCIHFGCDDGSCYEFAHDELIELEVEGGEFMSICEFNGEQYWGDNDYGLHRRTEHKLMPILPLGFVYALHASNTRLVAVGWREVFIFDGKYWAGFEFGYDGSVFLKAIDMIKRYGK